MVESVLAHAPLKPGDNESLETAMPVPDPTKSWAIYTELHEGGEAQYYRLDLGQGERLQATMFIPLEEEGFAPNLVIMGSDISSHDVVPEYLEVPAEAGVLLVEPNSSVQPSYEPFTPSSYYYLSNVESVVPVAGEYYIAVYEPVKGGRYGLAIGYREEFGLDEWLRIPFDVIGIHQWEGQALWFILAPLFATLIIGFPVAVWLKKKSFGTLKPWIGGLSGLLYIGSGFMMLTQMFVASASTGFDISMTVTLVFILLPVLLGLGVMKLTVKNGDHTTVRVRILTALLGLLGLFTWSGLVVGPSLAFLASILPSGKKE
ncbi:MAG: hypothetical protein NWF14_05375 [Candidatus Bathyarchaeota archaeon]|nr:hypothetical protein [Candidatus Bathyarchaeota archaeon]